MRANNFLAGVPFYNYPALLLHMLFHLMESIPTNAVLVVLIGVLIACSIHITSAAKAIVANAVAKSTANTNTQRTQQQALNDVINSAIFKALPACFVEQQELSDATNTANLEAILNRIAQLEAQRVTPPPASPRLTLSAISAMDTTPELPSHRRASLSVSGLSTQETTPLESKVPALSLSTISSQASALVGPVLLVASISTQTSETVLPKVSAFSFSPVSTVSSTPVEPLVPVLSFSSISTQTTSPVKPSSPVLLFSSISFQSSAPESPKLQRLSIGLIAEQSTAPVDVKAAYPSFSDIIFFGESVCIKAPSESYVVKWHSGDPYAIIKTLETITHGLVMQNLKLKTSIQVKGTYIAGELSRRKHQVEDLQIHYRSMCTQHVIDKASIAKMKTDHEEFARKVFDLNDKIANIAMLTEKAWASEDALKDQVATIGAQLGGVRTSESALKDQVANIEDQLDEARMKVASIEMELDSARSSESTLKTKVADVETELAETTMAKNALQERVFDVTAQLNGAMMSGSTSEEVARLQEQLAGARMMAESIQEELDDVRMTNFILQDEADTTNELLGETTALYDKVSNLEMELYNSRNSELVAQQQAEEYAAIIRAIQDAGINIDEYTQVTPIADEVTSSFGAGLDATTDTMAFTSPSEAKLTFTPAIEFETVINTAQNPLNPFASAFSFDPTSNFSSAIAIEAESPVTSPIFNKTTAFFGGGLGASKYATVPTTDTLPVIEAKAPVTEIITSAKGGLGSSKSAPAPTANASPALETQASVAKISTPIKGGLGASRHASETIADASPAPAVATEPAASKTKLPGGLGSSKYADESASNSSLAIEAATITTKVSAPRSGGLGASRYSDGVKPASLAPPASNQTPTKNAIVNVPGGSWIQPPGLGETVNDNPEDYQAEYHCNVCEKMVTVEFDFDIYSGEKIYLLDPHERDFHGKCPHCHENVPAIWDDRRDARDFSEHRKFCLALPTGWAICKGCREKIHAPLISTPQGRIHNFSKHNTTCPAKAKEKIILFYCDNCGEGMTNRSGFFENHSKPCFERACINKTVNAFDRETGARKPVRIHFYCRNCGIGVTDKSDFYENHKKSCNEKTSVSKMWNVYDGNTGEFVGRQPAMTTQSTTPKTATPHGTMHTFGKQSAPATPAASSSRTPQTGQRNGKAPARERRHAMPLFGGRGGRSPATPQTTGAASSWQGNVNNHQPPRAGHSTPNNTNTPPPQAGPSSSERRPPMPSFGGRTGSRPKADDGPQWQGNVIEYG